MVALRDGVPGFMTSKELTELGEPRLKYDKYILSLVEQEICKGKQRALLMYSV